MPVSHQSSSWWAYFKLQELSCTPNSIDSAVCHRINLVKGSSNYCDYLSTRSLRQPRQPVPSSVILTSIFRTLLTQINEALRAIIDWDGMCSEPRVIAPEACPGWLTRDWDPLVHGYFTSGSQFENSPEELEKYRQEYLRIVKALKSNKDGTEPEEVDVTLTRQSLVVENICIAARNWVCTRQIVEKAFKEIACLVAPESYQEIEGRDNSEDTFPKR